MKNRLEQRIQSRRTPHGAVSTDVYKAGLKPWCSLKRRAFFFLGVISFTEGCQGQISDGFIQIPSQPCWPCFMFADDIFLWSPKRLKNKTRRRLLDTFRRVARIIIFYNFEIQEYKEVAASTIHIA